MVQARTGTNFDIDAITRLVNADANAPAMSDQSMIDPMTEALEAEAEDFETELQNPSSNRVDEAQRFMERPGAAKLSAGRLSAIQSGITVAEKRDEFSFGSQRGDRILEEREKSEEKERAEKARAANVADDLNEVAERRQAEIERRERAEAWASRDHTYAGQKLSPEQWLRMVEWFKSPENRKAWEDAMMAETGESREKVRQTGEKVAALNELIAKESRGEVLTTEEQARKARLEKDAKVIKGFEVQNKMVNPSLARSASINSSLGTERIESRADAFAVADRAPAGTDSIDPSPTKAESVASAIQNAEQFLGTSVAREVDGVALQGERLNTTFARAASIELPASTVAPQLTSAQPKTAATFEANAAAMI